MVMLGNLSVQDIETRLAVKFPDDVREFMQDNHQQKAESIAAGKWHCFDIPFALVCGDIATAQRIYEGIKHLGPQMKQQMQIGVDQ